MRETDAPAPAPAAWVTADNAALFTDLYELSMAQAYVADGMADAEATFSLFVRRMPAARNVLLACGLESVLSYLETLHFSEDSLRYLASVGRFTPRFLDWLRALRFTGSVRAVPEGTPVFAEEPILEITAPIAQAQIVETFVMNQVHAQTMQASKALRVVQAAAGRRVVDFGARRDHGTDSAVKAARAFWIAGGDATSNVLAGRLFGLPVTGTMAHSYVQAFGSEAEAFRAFARRYPDTTLLVDTYDTLQGVRRVADLARELGGNFSVRAVRLDSGNLAELAKGARAILDGAGLADVQIFASGSLDEHRIAATLAAGAPIDAFGVGTQMGVSGDAPSLDTVYKLTAYAGHGRLKLSPGKYVLPGRKQVWRTLRGAEAAGDVIAREEESLPGRPLLQLVMDGGARLAAGAPALDDIRAYARAQIASLPAPLRGLAAADPPFRVAISPALARYSREVEEAVAGTPA